jgi:enoyl-CoA hydratase
MDQHPHFIEFKIEKISDNSAIALITLHRPKSLNSLNSKLLIELDEILTEINHAKDIRVVIITGSGKAFAAGADIAEIHELKREEANALSELGQGVFEKMEKLPQVSIAAINGFALGGGFELALACDIRLCSEDAFLGQPEVKLGLLPGFGGTQRLVRLAGESWARYMILTGERIHAAKALEIGLVHEILASDLLLDRARELAQKISKNGPLALAAVKRVFYKSIGQKEGENFLIERAAFAGLFPEQDGDMANEAMAGTNAFLEKRLPNF